ncbi:MAG: hypothetical protein MN733_03950, partial [Nitrososphaera sp.]|nr:hypothetical protein [Nitrososphaera sp.]
MARTLSGSSRKIGARDGRSIFARLADDANRGDRDALDQLIQTIDTKQTGGGFTGFLKETASDVLDVAGRGLDLLSRGQFTVAEPIARLQALVDDKGETPSGSPAENIG